MRTTIHASQLALAMVAFWIGLGGDAGTKADLIIDTPAGLATGDTFRIAFVTFGTTDATSTSISTYNRFVNADASAQAGGGPVVYHGTTLTFAAIGSTAATSAIANIGETGAPVYLASGIEVTPSDTAMGLWSGTLLHNLNQDLIGDLRQGAAWTGTDPNGHAYSNSELGATLGSAIVGAAQFTNSYWVTVETPPTDEKFQMYGISQVLTVGELTSAPEPSTLWTAGAGMLGGVLVYGRSRKRPGLQ